MAKELIVVGGPNQSQSIAVGTARNFSISNAELFANFHQLIREERDGSGTE